MKNVRSTLGSKTYWVGAIAGIILLAVLASLFFTQEQINPNTVRNGKILTASMTDRVDHAALA